MNLFDTLMTQFSLETKSLDDLIQISILVDSGKRNFDSIPKDTDEKTIIAKTIVELLNDSENAETGYMLYQRLSELIVSKNALMVDSDAEREQYETLKNEGELGKYSVQRRKDGYRFILKSSSGEVLAVSELYSGIESCIRGISSVQKSSTGGVDDTTESHIDTVVNPKFEIFYDQENLYRFRLKARNGEILAISEPYHSKALCVSAIEALKKNARTELIDKA